MCYEDSSLDGVENVYDGREMRLIEAAVDFADPTVEIF